MRKHILQTMLVLVSTLLVGHLFAAERPQRKQLFNYEWKFNLGDSPEYKAPDFKGNDWRKLDLPHDWSIEGRSERDNPSAGEGGFYPTGIGWYRKTFTVPAKWDGQKVGIYFEGVYMDSEVFINSQSLGIQPYGYTSFQYDLTPYLHFGKANTIAVRVDNSQQRNCRWYSGSGIYRHVWLVVTNPVHVAQWGLNITTPKVMPEKAEVQVSTWITNGTSAAKKLTLSTVLTDRSGRIAGKQNTKITIPAGSEQEIIQNISIDDPALWSPHTPYLYRANLMLKQRRKELDAVEQPFGVRTIEFSAEKGFLLNGKATLLNGGCVHHDNGCLGAASYDRAEVRKAELLKSAGFNAVRTSHNPPSESFLYACDSLGLLVIDEAFDGWREQKTPQDYHRYFDQWWAHDLKSMVLRDRNHPSIILWSIGNEVIERKKPEATETAKELSDLVHKLDPTRPVTSAMTTWDQDWAVFDPLMAAHDVCGYNYQLHHAEADHKRAPSRIIVQTESYPKDAFYCWDQAQKHPYVIGDFVWTALDYLGESGIGRYYYPGEPEGEHWSGNLHPYHGAYCGDVDLTGWRKPISHYRSMLYNDTEKLYMAVREPNPATGAIKLTKWAVWPTWERWNWSGYEGKDIQVEVYSKYPAVRLYLNGERIGEQSTTVEQEFKATFNVPYAAGELRAVGLEGDKEVGEVCLKTTGEPANIRLTADRKAIKADGQDLSYITVEMIDAEGNLVPDAANDLKFDVIGSGVIAGVDNGSLKDTALYVANTRKAWNGRALLVVKSTREAGPIHIKVSTDVLPEAFITIVSH